MNRRILFLLIMTLLGAGTTAALGFWQLNRAAQKARLQTQLQIRQALPTQGAQDLVRASTDNFLLPAEFLDRQVAVRGVWLPEHTLFLDNRQMNQRTGLLVLTPLRISGTTASPEPVLLVQRGWIPRNFIDRNHLPAISTPTGSVTVHGRLTTSPARLYEFKEQSEGKLRQNVSIAALSKEMGLEFFSQSLLQTDQIENDSTQPALLRQWPAAASGIEKHYGYAFQWFLLSSLILGLFIWFQFIQPRLHRKRM